MKGILGIPVVLADHQNNDLLHVTARVLNGEFYCEHCGGSHKSYAEGLKCCEKKMRGENEKV